MASEKIDALSLDISASLNTDNLDKVINKLGELDKALNKLKSKTLTVNINDARSAIDNTTPSVDKLTSSFLNQTVKIAAVIAVFKKLYTVISDGVANAAEYTKTLNMFTVSLGEYADNATKYGETVSDALGIDLAGWQNTQGIFDTLIKGMGVTSDKAAYMSQNLTQLAYDISSFYGITLTEAANKLKSAMAGRTQPARAIGYAPDQANAVDYAKNPKNYGKQTFAINQQTGAIEANTIATDENTQHKIVNFNQLTSAEKSIIRYNLLMSQNTQVQGNFARALNDPYNQLKIFKDQLNMTSRAFGNMFIPALNKVLPYLSAFAQLATQAFQSLARLFGFELPDVKDRTTIDTKPYDDVVKATGKAKNNAKKMKDYMLGIDELNVFNPNTGAGAGGGGGVGGENSNLKNMKLRGYDFLGKAVENSIKKAREAIQKLFNDWKQHPITLPLKIIALGFGELAKAGGEVGAGFWEWFLGKSPEKLKQEADEYGRTVGEQFCVAFAEKIQQEQVDFWSLILGKKPDELEADAQKTGTATGSKFVSSLISQFPSVPSEWFADNLFLEAILGTPDKMAKRAGEAGRDIADQFVLEFGIKCATELAKHPILTWLFEKATGHSLKADLEGMNRALMKTKTPAKKAENPYGYVSADKAKQISAIQNGTKNNVVTADLVIRTPDIAKSETVIKGKVGAIAKDAVSTYDNEFSSEETKSKTTAAANVLYNSALVGANNNGTATSEFGYVSFDMAKNYVANLGTKTQKAEAYTATAGLAIYADNGLKSKNGAFRTTGEQAGEGYVLGVKKYEKESKKVGGIIGLNALNQIRKTLGIKSPSKEFAKVGRYSVEGFAGAMEKNKNLVTTAATDLGKSALNALTSASDMSNKIILNGTIADPSASVSAKASNASGIGYGIGASNDYAMASLASQIYQAVVSGMTAASANNEDKDIKVIIDGKEVFKAVQTESRKRGIAVSNGTFSR